RPAAGGLPRELRRAEQRRRARDGFERRPRRKVSVRRASDPPRVERRLLREGDASRREREARAQTEDVEPFEKEGAPLGLEELERRQVDLRRVRLDLSEVGQDG